MRVQFIDSQGQQRQFDVPRVELNVAYSTTEGKTYFNIDLQQEVPYEPPYEQKMVGQIAQLQGLTIDQYNQINEAILGQDLKFIALYDHDDLVFLVRKDMIKRQAITLVGTQYLYQLEFEYTLDQWNSSFYEFNQGV